MSEPPNTTTSQHIILHHQPPTPPHPLSTTTTSTSLIREYRKGNWNLHETLVLITAKKLDDERRTKASTTPPDPTSHHQQQQQCRTAELRWKWVENYCWKNGCLRSQNQCNDKWDNLLRDYKKVREYEARRSNTTDDQHLQSYWTLEKHQRKERNLPTNLLSEIYEALNQVVHRRYSSKTLLPPTPLQVVLRPIETPPPPPPPPTLTTAAAGVSAETSDSSEADESEKLDSDTKRRKVRRLGSSIVKSASVLAQTIMTCEEKKEKRHRDILELKERRLRIEEARNEVNREGMAGLISAVTDLSGAIQALVSDSTNGGGDSAT